MNQSSRFSGEQFAAELSQLEKDPAYQKLLTGKRVIVVGPAQTLLGGKQGRMIDDYDLVVRFNTVVEYLPFTPELAKDIGTRTDILYCNNEVLMYDILRQRLVSHERFASLVEAVGFKYLIATNNNFTHQNALASPPTCQAEEETFRQFLNEKKISIGFSMGYAIPDLAGRWLGGHVGRTGFLAIADLLRYDISRLHIIGMTFYHKGGHLFLKDSVNELDPLRNHRGELPPSPEIPGHNSYLELEIMKALARHFRHKLELAAELRALLEDNPDKPEPNKFN